MKIHPKDRLLWLIVALCITFALIRFGEFVYNHVPPYKENQCMMLKENPLILIKVTRNHILEGYSDIDFQVLFVERDLKASFSELRDLDLVKVNCP